MMKNDLSDLLCLHCRHAYGFKSVEWPRGDAVLGFSCRVYDIVIKGDKAEGKPELRYLRTKCLTYEEASE